MENRLEIKQGYLIGEVWTNAFSVLELTQKLRMAVSNLDLETWEECQKKLEEKLDLSKKINRQYVEGIVRVWSISRARSRKQNGSAGTRKHYPYTFAFEERMERISNGNRDRDLLIRRQSCYSRLLLQKRSVVKKRKQWKSGSRFCRIMATVRFGWNIIFRK
ncbi:MAG: hypothetical protein ACLRMN_11485 [Mediterraneibacter gnavus]